MRDSVRSDRIIGLDLWRALLMMGGLLLHASVLQPPTVGSEAFDLVSGSFRMGAFFTISGLLAGFSMNKRPLDHWLRTRLVQIGVPTVFALLVLCPGIDLLLRRGIDRLWPSGGWYHIWFLVALLVYACLAYALERFDRRHFVFARLEAWTYTATFRPWHVLIGCGLLIFGLILGTLRTLDALGLCRDHIWLAQARLIVGYAPLYLFGVTLARAPRFRGAMLISRRMPLLHLAGIIGVYLLSRLGAHNPAPGAGVITDLTIFAAAFAPAPASLLIIRSALTVDRVPSWLARLSAASFTVYLLHLPVLYAINLMIVPMTLNAYLEFGLSAFIAGCACYLFHAWVVIRSPILQFLLNGRVTPLALMAPLVHLDQAKPEELVDRPAAP